MLSTPKILLLIGLTVLVPTIAQATFIDIASFSGKTYAGQFAQIEYKFDFHRTNDHSKLLGSLKNIARQDANRSRLDIGASKAIIQSLNLNKTSRFSYNLTNKRTEHKGFLKGKYKDKYKRKAERSISVPEPGTVALLAMGLAGLVVSRRGEQPLRKQA